MARCQTFRSSNFKVVLMLTLGEGLNEGLNRNEGLSEGLNVNGGINDGINVIGEISGGVNEGINGGISLERFREVENS